MREFGKAISYEKRADITRAAMVVFNATPNRKLARASEFELDVADDPVVVYIADVRWKEGRLRIAVTTQEAQPSFEWQVEITSNVDETDYFKHYLILDEQVVLAQRKVLTPIDEEEAAVILADLAKAEAVLDAKK